MTTQSAEPGDKARLALRRMAHELQTPLGVGRMAASLQENVLAQLTSELAGSKSIEPDVLVQAIEELQESAVLLSESIERSIAILDAYKDQAKNAQGAANLFFLSACLREAVAFPLAKSKHIKVHSSFDVAPDLTLQSDRPAWLEVIGNLVNNSLLHGFKDREEGHIHASACRLPEGQVEVKYSDDGVGLSAEARSHLFDDGFTTAHHEGGQGLGMGIVRNLVETRLRGTLTVENPATGTGFRIVVPASTSNSI